MGIPPLSLFPDLLVFRELAPLFLRLALGVIFIIHGYPKLFKNFLGTAEFLCGILLLAGFLTQPASLLLAVDMAVRIWKNKFSGGFVGGWEFEFLILFALLSLLVLGPGALSIDLPL